MLVALKDGSIYGAGLDVLCHEPAAPERYSELYKLENVVIQPHMYVRSGLLYALS